MSVETLATYPNNPEDTASWLRTRAMLRALGMKAKGLLIVLAFVTAGTCAAQGPSPVAPTYPEKEHIMALLQEGAIKEAREKAMAWGSATKAKGASLEHAESFMMLGRCAYLQSDHPSAMAGWRSAQELFEQLAEDPKLTKEERQYSKQRSASALNNMSVVLMLQGEKRKAIGYLQKVLVIERSLGNQLEIAMTLNNLGMLLHETGEAEQGLRHLRECYDLRRLNSDSLGMAHALNCIGLVLMRDSLEAATKAVQMATVLLDRHGSLGDRAMVRGTKAELELLRGDTLAAIRAYAQSMAEARGTERLDIVRDSAEELYTLLELTGRKEEAFEAYKTFIQARDSITSINTRQEVLRHQYEFELAKKEQAAQADIAEQRLIRNLSALALLTAIVVILIITIQRSRIKKAKERAEQSERFKQQFLANMSHEIRTPMNAIMGMSGILKRNPHTPEQKNYLDAIAQSSENLLVILNDILDLSKLEAGRIEFEHVPFESRAVLTNVRDILRFKAEEKGLTLSLDIDAAVPERLMGDPTRLNQIVLNLAGNAVKFTEQGSVSILVRCSDRPEGPGNTMLQVQVTDTGIGIPPDRLDKIFDEFTQAYSDTTRKYGGTGLGLTISKRLAELQGGSIAVKSEQGRGSTFTVYIPYAITDASPDNGQRTTNNPLPDLANLRILLAEDNTFNAMVAQDELADAIPGVQVDVAANGRIALEMVQAKEYDV
ncbi:MAG: tetratricopeptide repeat protein, partial [Flavobacteriales bacterium]|nr:tetratricopeptide repeat protein [Flavobacteriales bacterium]